MRKLLVVLLLAAALPMACGTRDRRPPKGPGALDLLLLSERSEENGAVRFRHRDHYGPVAEGGSGIDCETCHHDYEGEDEPPPGSCRTCHSSHDDEAPNRDLPFL